MDSFKQLSQLIIFYEIGRFALYVFWKLLMAKRTKAMNLDKEKSRLLGEIKGFEESAEWYAKDTDFSFEKYFSVITGLEIEKGYSYDQAVRSPKGKRAAFDLLLHLQWVAYNFESARQHKAKLQKIIDPNWCVISNVESYHTLVEKTCAYPAMLKRVELLIEWMHQHRNDKGEIIRPEEC
jgi:hypothetical protein